MASSPVSRPLLTPACAAFVTEAARVSLPKLIDGETGTGKTILAAEIHRRSARSQGPFIAIGCGNLKGERASSDFLGHERGAFTGATERRRGIIEQAHGGTLVLNDLDALPAELQSHLLHLFDYGEVTRLGSEKPVPVDVQVIVTTNRPPEQHVREGKLRADVFARLSVFRYTCPRLADRPDVPELAKVILEELHAKTLGKDGAPLPKLTTDALEIIAAHKNWPMNCRSLAAVLLKCLLQVREGVIDAGLVKRILNEWESRWRELDARDESDEAREEKPRKEPYRMSGTPEEEKKDMERALSETRGNATRAAELMRMARATFNSRIREYRIAIERFRNRSDREGA